MGDAPDYVRLVEEVLSLRNVPEPLARTLVAQALVIEDRRDVWQRTTARAIAGAPPLPGVYVFLNEARQPLYVGKALNLQRRLKAHFAPRRWRTLPPALARVEHVEWLVAGSELEALLLEAQWIQDLSPAVNVQTGDPDLDTRALPRAGVRDVLLVLPAADAGSVVLILARATGAIRIVRCPRAADAIDAGTFDDVWRFFHEEPPASARPLAPLVYSWLRDRGTSTTRIELDGVDSRDDLRARLESILSARDLFAERLVVRRQSS